MEINHVDCSMASFYGPHNFKIKNIFFFNYSLLITKLHIDPKIPRLQKGGKKTHRSISEWKWTRRSICRTGVWTSMRKANLWGDCSNALVSRLRLQYREQCVSHGTVTENGSKLHTFDYHYCESAAGWDTDWRKRLQESTRRDHLACFANASGGLQGWW